MVDNNHMAKGPFAKISSMARKNFPRAIRAPGAHSIMHNVWQTG